jgi:hypothetical protein
MDQKIIQEESPENRPNFRCEDDTVFIYAKERSVYEPYEKAKEDQEKAGAAERKKSPNPFVKYWGEPMCFWITTVIGLAGVVVVGMYTHYAREQWCVMSQTLHEMKTQTDNARDAMERDERAWITVFDFAKTNDPTVFELILINTGRTPARHFKVSAGADINKTVGPEHGLDGMGLIAPNGKFTLPLLADGVPTTKTQLKVHGLITYDSIFGGGHSTQFCFILAFPKNGQIGFTPCESGNEVDSNPH